MAHTPQQLKEASNKLEYHVKSYVETFLWRLDHATKGKDPSPESNAVLDSHLIHTRLLIFFLMEKRIPTDVNAADFFNDGNGFKALESTTLDEWREKINRRLVHLTTIGLTEFIREIEWNFGEIAGELVPRLKEFFSNPATTKLIDRDREQSLEKLALLDPSSNSARIRDRLDEAK